jgi:hypothetical protein
MVGKVLEITFVAVLAYLILANATAFSTAVQSVGAVYGNSVKTLQGR